MQSLMGDLDRARAQWQQESTMPEIAPDWDKLRLYAGELYRWSSQMSLISRGDRPFLATRHLLPSLGSLPVIAALPHRTVIDFGSGAGLPGIPLAASLPATRFILVESRRRRVTFLRHVVRCLQLANVEIAHTRLEQWAAPPTDVDCLITRAARTDAAIPTAAARLLAPHGVLLHYQDTRRQEPASTGLLWSGHPRGIRDPGALVITIPARTAQSARHDSDASKRPD
jgi:16S rRNA (guanine527-N7)-methyltransferase